MFAACTLFLAACGKQTVKIMTPPDASNRILFSAEQLQTTLDKAGYQVMMQQGDTTFSDPEIKTILLTEVNDTTLKKEGFHITTTGNLTRVCGRDGSGVHRRGQQAHHRKCRSSRSRIQKREVQLCKL